MALSEDRLLAMWQGDSGDRVLRPTLGSKKILSFARAIEGEVRKHDEALIRQLVEALEAAKPVHANSRNTPEVRTGHSMGGFVEHYIVPTHVVNILLNAARARLEGKP